ncbi:hypothetical protein ACFQE5_02465 [Pseudonocardia hispaniensis]|uniref:Pecanex-like protein 1 n=1 Tax=Pseudonocardia hispaniensis TaxID=904933 RepID=A0ABW1IXY0_9PSEU
MTTRSAPRTRLRAVLATSVAALAVILGPAACGYAEAAPNPSAAADAGAGAGDNGGQTGSRSGNAGDRAGNGENRDGQAGNRNGSDRATNAGDRATNAGDRATNAGDRATNAGERGGNAGDRANNAKERGGNAGQPPQQGGNAGAGEAPPQAAPPPAADNGLDVLGRDCTTSALSPHDGFQVAPRCVSTSFGEVASAAKSPSLLITQAPTEVAAGQPFQLKVSTRNLVRDRFLSAAAGGYYLESSFLDGNGLQRGHFHTACRMLPGTDVAPDASPAPEFFVATQDNGGGAAPDSVTIDVPGLPTAGTAQCSSWAGDGSHRIPMMERANQTPAFDSVRISVK